MPKSTPDNFEVDEAAARERNRHALEQARAVGALGPTRDAALSCRVSATLLEAAERRAKGASHEDLIELALCRMALEDDFGPRLVRLKGRIPADLDLGV